jgi:hypothetical protein
MMVIPDRLVICTVAICSKRLEHKDGQLSEREARKEKRKKDDR